MSMRPILCLCFCLLITVSSEGAPRSRRPILRDALRGIALRYTRVEGIFAGYQFKVAPPAWNGLSVWAEAGYGTQNKALRWALGTGWIRPPYLFSFTAFDRTETNDHGIISTPENTLFALLYKGDYRDYFHTKNGFETRAVYELRPALSLQAHLSAFTYASMPVATEWSLFYPHRSFRPNPAVTPGNVGLLHLGAVYDTRRYAPRFLNAWYLGAFYERGFREFPFNGFQVAFTRHQKTIWGNQAFILQGQIAARTRTDEQFLFDLGGVGTLRGFGIKEFTGNRMVMANFDYLFRGDVFEHLALPGAHLFNLVLFADTGWTRIEPKSAALFDGFQHLAPGDFKTDVGLAIGVTERAFRFNIARRLDRNTRAWTFSARFFRQF